MFFCVLSGFSPANLTEISFRNCPSNAGIFWKTPSRKTPKTQLLNKRKGILLPPEAFRGAFQKNDTCFPLFCCVCKCHFRTRTWGGSQGTPWCSRNTQTKNDTLKMTLGRARKIEKFQDLENFPPNSCALFAGSLGGRRPPPPAACALGLG